MEQGHKSLDTVERERERGSFRRNTAFICYTQKYKIKRTVLYFR